MKDIAKRANVSIGTVSRVLNRAEDVDEQLRARVEAAARKLGYELSARTRNMVHSKSRVIGLMLCNDFGFTTEQSLLLLGVEECCSMAEYYLLFARYGYSSAAPAEDLNIPAIVQTPGLADCLIVAGSVHKNLREAFDRHRIKYVLLANHVVQNGTVETPLRFDDEGGYYEATRYLAQLGHKNIWYIGDASRQWNRNRQNGYSRAMTDLKLDPHVHSFSLSDDEFENGQATVAHILEGGRPVTAILAASDELAVGAREGLRQHRREVPKDVSLIGFENESARTRGSNLTSVSVDMIEVGRQLARAAIAKIEQRDKDYGAVTVPAVLIKRSTCRPLRPDDHMML